MAQPNTEVFLLDISEKNGSLDFTNPRNISNNDGYDNQPSFYDKDMVSFSSTRNGQTDIAQYHLDTQKLHWINDTPGGSEYSPLRVPKSKHISAIRLDTTGLQRLYQYNTSTGKSKELLKDLKVGYHVWYNKDILVFTVLVNGGMDLMIAHLQKGTQKTVYTKVGRSLHKIPNSDLVSFIGYENNRSFVFSLDPNSGETKKLIYLPSKVQDICWLGDGSILMAQGNRIMKFNPQQDANWKEIKQFDQKELYSLSRMAVSENGKLLAVVAEESPEVIVQKQLDAYNARDIEAFLATYSDNVKVYNYPHTLSYEGKANMKTGYSSLFTNVTDLNCVIKNRIVIGNKVIDEEYLTMNGNNFSATAIYEVANGKIIAVTFIQ